MEPSQFDELTKALAIATSRRQALKTLAATTIGGLLGLDGLGTAFAKCKPGGIGCNTNSQCCSGTCCHGKCCDSGQTCQNGTCVTPCLALQQPCTSASQCCDTGQDATTCAPVATLDGGIVACCNVSGGSCSSNQDCCLTIECINGTCQA